MHSGGIMRFKNLDLNLLVALDTLFRTRNVSEAAKEMFITQSAMSNALKRLRDYFDDPLLVPVGRQMVLTPCAEALKDPIRDILVQIETAIHSGPNFDPLTSTRSVTILASDYSLHAILPEFMKRLALQAPLVTTRFLPQRKAPHIALEQGEADLLIVPQLFCSPDHPFELLFEDELVCAVDANGPHAGDTLSVEAFLAAAHVVMQPPDGRDSFAQAACRDAGLELRTTVQTYSFASILSLVEGTDRIGVVQKRLFEALGSKLGLRMVAPPLPLPRLPQVLQWREHSSLDPFLTWLRKQLHATAGA
jgi:LysR family transcriptional regulator, nod-box dependent transcriptional activator